jgi:hypothetical protein
MGDDASDRVYEVAADLFSLLSTILKLPRTARAWASRW